MQCDQTGLALKLLGGKFSYKRSPIIYLTDLGYLKTLYFKQICFAFFLGDFWKKLGCF